MDQEFLSIEEFLQQIRWRVQHTSKAIDDKNYELAEEHSKIVNDVLLPTALRFNFIAEAIRTVSEEMEKIMALDTSKAKKRKAFTITSDNLTEEIPKELV